MQSAIELWERNFMWTNLKGLLFKWNSSLCNDFSFAIAIVPFFCFLFIYKIFIFRIHLPRFYYFFGIKTVFNSNERHFSYVRLFIHIFFFSAAHTPTQIQMHFYNDFRLNNCWKKEIIYFNETRKSNTQNHVTTLNTFKFHFE